MKKKLKFTLLILLLLIISCNKKSNESSNKNNKKIADTSENITLHDSIIDLAKKGITKGDTLAYKKAYRYFSINHYEKEFLYYSLTMADKYEYSQAYFDTYTILINVNSDNNITGCNVCQYYLLKSFEKNNHYAKGVVKELFIDKGLKIPTSFSVLQNK